MSRMSLDEEISAIEATVNGLENEMESGKFSVKTIVDELQSHINSTSDFATQMAKGQETMDRILDKISKLDIGYLTALKYNHSHEPHVCEVLNRAANCIMKFMDIGFAANELFGDPDVRAQIKSQNQELRKGLKEMLSSLL